MANINYSELAREMDYFIVKRFRELVGNQYMQGGLGDAIGNEFQILLYDVSDTKVHVYEHSEVGFAAAVAAAASGDVILIPPGTITGNHALGNSVEVRGMGVSSILSGEITGAVSIVSDLNITNDNSALGFMYGVDRTGSAGDERGNNIAGLGIGMTGNAYYNVIGGDGHTITSGDRCIIGGDSNAVDGECGMVAGYDNTLGSGSYCAVVAGRGNEVSADYGGVFTGRTNTSSADYAVVLGGTGCIASGANSLAWGTQVKPSHAGAMLLCDDSAFDFASSVADEFAVRATGGVRIITAIDGAGAATETFSISTAGAVIVPGNLTIGDGSAGVDNTITVNGETNDLVLTWMEDENVLETPDGFAGTPDEITAVSGAGTAAAITTLNTEVTTNGDEDLDNVTLANGISGQMKNIYCVVEGHANDTWKITPATMCGGTQITFAGVGLGCTLVYADNEGWVVTGNNGGTIS